MEISPYCINNASQLKQAAAHLVGVIGFSTLVAYSNISQAHPAECMNETAPAVFLPASGIVCLQKIKVIDSAGTEYYKASLELFF